MLAIALRRRNLTEKQRADVLAHATRFAFSSLPYDKVGAAGAGTNTGRGGLLAGFGCAISLLLCAPRRPPPRIAGVSRVAFLAKLGEFGVETFRQTEADVTDDVAHARTRY